jgi:hypothetical protein
MAIPIVPVESTHVCFGPEEYDSESANSISESGANLHCTLSSFAFSTLRRQFCNRIMASLSLVSADHVKTSGHDRKSDSVASRRAVTSNSSSYVVTKSTKSSAGKDTLVID